MQTRWIRRLAGITGLVAVVSLAHAAESAIPAATASDIIKQDIAFLQKGLAKEPQRKQLPGLKATAIMVAGLAQEQMTGPNTAKMAALRDQALKVADLLAAKDYAKAKDAAKALDTPPASTATAKVEVHKHAKFDISEAMAPYRSSRSGGMDMERNIRSQSKSASDLTLIKDIAGHSVILGEFTKHLPTGQAAVNAARKKKWEDYSDEMIKHSKEILAEASKASPDKAALKKKLVVLDTSCTNCHNEFRD
ncbi:MAG: hypothetical protein LC104_00690 [Bacteroidales bacterium]|nr:hypothetical protein [Bacteroidales bacterium]